MIMEPASAGTELAPIVNSSRSPALKIDPRRRPPANPPRLRAGVVRLSDQPFPQSCARQYFDGCPCHRRPLPHPVLAISPRRNRVLCRGAGPFRPRNLGALPAPAIPLESHRAAAARPWPEHPGADHLPYRRRAARPGAFGHRETLSAGFLCRLDRIAAQDVADVRRPDRRLDSRQHRALFLAPDEGVLQTRRALSPRWRGADSDAGHARPLSGRTRLARDSDSAAWKADNLSQRHVGTPAEQQVLETSRIIS